VEWGLNDEKVAFVPYWRNNGVRTGDDNVLVSQWRLPDRVILVAFNQNKASAPKNVTLKGDWARLGLATGTPYEITAHELAENGDNDVMLNGDTLSVPGLAPHTARYIGIQLTDKLAREQLIEELTSVGVSANAVTAELLCWGIVSQHTKFLPFGTVSDAKCADAEIKVAMWQLPDRILLAVKNSGKAEKNALIHVDLDRLGLTPQLPWQEFVRVRDFAVDGEVAAPASLDFYGRTLTVPTLNAGDVRLVEVRRHPQALPTAKAGLFEAV
jgi:hypothetical protein